MKKLNWLVDEKHSNTSRDMRDDILWQETINPKHEIERLGLLKITSGKSPAKVGYFASLHLQLGYNN